MLMNYVDLKKDTPTRMHFTDHYMVEREIWDPGLGRFKVVRSLVFWVDELDGEPTAKTFSVLSEKLASMLRPYLPNHTYVEKDFVITKHGEGFATTYTVEAHPRIVPAT